MTIFSTAVMNIDYCEMLMKEIVYRMLLFCKYVAKIEENLCIKYIYEVW